MELPTAELDAYKTYVIADTDDETTVMHAWTWCSDPAGAHEATYSGEHMDMAVSLPLFVACAKAGEPLRLIDVVAARTADGWSWTIRTLTEREHRALWDACSEHERVVQRELTAAKAQNGLLRLVLRTRTLHGCRKAFGALTTTKDKYPVTPALAAALDGVTASFAERGFAIEGTIDVVDEIVDNRNLRYSR
jgi:hypothetical protein